MRFDIATYALTSTLTFTVAFVISLRLFVESELYKSVSECYAAYDVEPIDSTLRLLREGAPFPFRFHRQMPAPACNGYIATYFNYVESQKISLLFHTNMAICCAIVMGSIIIKVFFGELWPMESQHMYDRMLNFLLFKVIFIGAVMDPIWRHILRLSIWIGVLGFLRIFCLLSRDRFDNLATIAYTPPKQYYKITLLLCFILLGDVLWYIGSALLFPASLTFLTLEFLPVILDTIHVMTKYLSHLLDQWQENGFENKCLVNYYTELGADVLILACTLMQYLQLMWMHGVSFGLVDFVLFLNVRSVLKNLHNKVLIHRERWRAMSYVRDRYVNATPAELSLHNDDCAICREKMKTAKKLACGHLFHLHCLHSWIQHHVSKPTCPTCRRPLSPSAKDPSSVDTPS